MNLQTDSHTDEDGFGDGDGIYKVSQLVSDPCLIYTFCLF